MTNITIDFLISQKILKVYWCTKTRDFLIVNLTDIDYQVVDYYSYCKNDNIFTRLCYREVESNEIDDTYQLEETLFDDDRFELKFPDEETALYFNLKFGGNQ